MIDKYKAPQKITEAQYYELMLKEDITDEEILEYSKIVKGEGGFDWVLVPDSDKVELSIYKSFVTPIDLGNRFARRRREVAFFTRLLTNNLPILVSEGDSWFQFPVLIREVIDQLENDYLIWSVGAAGDTASNMVFGETRRGKTEYIRALRSQKERVQGFLFSGAGNDILGEDPDTGEASLLEIIKEYQPGNNNPYEHIDFSAFGRKMSFLKDAYETVIGNIRLESGLENLPIFVHGYDYVFPYPWNEEGGDPRNPLYADNDQWIGQPFKKRGYPDIPLRREIMKILIDTLYDMLNGVAGDSQSTQVWVVDCRGAMPNLSDWNDEIHGNSDGFAKVAARFNSVISQVING